MWQRQNHEVKHGVVLARKAADADLYFCVFRWRGLDIGTATAKTAAIARHVAKHKAKKYALNGRGIPK